MKRYVCLLILLTAAAALPSLAVEDRETIQQNYPFASKVDVRNLNGSIRVTGYAGNEIQFIARKRIEATSQEALEQAKREVRMDVQSGGGVFRVCVLGPWRDSCSTSEAGKRSSGCLGDCDRGYTVRYDFELQVPAAAVLALKTVNGAIRAEAVQGAFEIKTVNGGLELRDMGGSGTAHTVNGAVKLSFRNSPAERIDAKTVNGSIEAAFPKTLNAVLRFRTVHGDVFTNFSATTMAGEQPRMEKRNGRTVIRSNNRFAVRVGGGGPEHSFETVNGSIQISEQQ